MRDVQVTGRVAQFLKWLEDTADPANDGDRNTLAIGRALAWFHEQVHRISVDPDTGMVDGWTDIAELYNDENYEPLSRDTSASHAEKRRKTLKKYVVRVREVHVQPYTIEAESPGDAVRRVANNDDGIAEGDLEYSHTLDRDTWTVEEMPDTPPAGRRIMARFQPQAWLNGCGIDIDGAYEFDVTEAVLAMGREAALALEDHTEETDQLWLQHPVSEQRPHHGPFEVEVQDAIRRYFDEAPAGAA